ncbi:MAG: sigma 54-interacting transcriptional regulator [Deltaproteobacteria bacterium]|nr:sigma 54-interacting transcriptional regulator [Deltaproteobacteria bacterium]
MATHNETQIVQEQGSGGRVAVRQRPRISWSDEAGAHTVIVEDRMVIGSAPGVDLQIALPTVSRLHAEFEPREDGLWVRDLGSRNGTFIDGIRIECARLMEGSTLAMGTARLVVAEAALPVAVDLWPTSPFHDLVGASTAMRALFARLAKVAKSDVTTLILGETGTGKELVAKAIHEHSARADGAFQVVDCGALPENLLEAELFGHVKGAFTGASSSRAGAFEVAAGGTVFLDEIGEMPLTMQPKLLRVLESQTVKRLGETQHRKVDCRIVSATNRDLRALVNAGAFREDLYFRLAVVPVVVPPLRERRDDIPLLLEHFIRGRDCGFDAAFKQDLMQRPWMGNVRELRNFVEQALVLGTREALRSMPTAAEKLPEVPADKPFKDIRDEWMNHIERQYIARLLERLSGNVTAVAEAAGLDRSYVHRLIKKHDL